MKSNLHLLQTPYCQLAGLSQLLLQQSKFTVHRLYHSGWHVFLIESTVPDDDMGKVVGNITVTKPNTLLID